jgi:CHAD domain-containing protein
MALNSRELGHRLQQLRKSLKDFSRNPSVDQVHDLRTRARRVAFILEALELGSAGNERKILGHLKAIRTRAGDVRDGDVFTSHVVGLGIKDDPGCVIQLVQYLGVKRYRQAGKLHRLVQRDADDLRRRLKRSQRKVELLVKRFAKSKLDLKRGPAKDDGAPIHAMSVALGLSRELSSVTHLGPKNLHSYRIEVKRLRYVLEMAEEETGEQHRLIEELKLVQDAIGEWHDWVELSNIAHDVLQHGKNCDVTQKIEETARKKFDEALRVTEQLRQRYLRPSGPGGKSGKSKSQKAGATLSKPVLVATSEMAA